METPKHTLIIAEAGINHNGSMQLAKQLIDIAADAGCDFVKFQTFKTELIISKDAMKAAYQIENATDKAETQFEMAKKLELSFDQFVELKDYCAVKKVGFLSTAFDLESLDFLDSLQMPFFKIPSGEVTNFQYLQSTARKGKPVILSTGMAGLEEVVTAIEVLQREGLSKSDITVLHCNTQYPTPMKDVNLHAMLHLKSVLGVPTGYSDHTLGIEVPIAAVALGATVIEKHFTIDRTMPGPDHAASLEPGELKSMVAAIRNVELAISGSGIKEPSDSESPNKVVARRSIYSKHALPKGHQIKEEDLIMMRPGDGISPMDMNLVIGTKLLQQIEAETKLQWHFLEK